MIASAEAFVDARCSEIEALLASFGTALDDAKGAFAELESAQAVALNREEVRAETLEAVASRPVDQTSTDRMEELTRNFNIYKFFAKLEIAWRNGPTLPQILLAKYVLPRIRDVYKGRYTALMVQR
ncbi:MAG: hypothetical protein WC846_05290 [Candidatus Gracilibacteria bacterium]|jgi:hypothetical protein